MLITTLYVILKGIIIFRTSLRKSGICGGQLGEVLVIAIAIPTFLFLFI